MTGDYFEQFKNETRKCGYESFLIFPKDSAIPTAHAIAIEEKGLLFTKSRIVGYVVSEARCSGGLYNGKLDDGARKGNPHFTWDRLSSAGLEIFPVDDAHEKNLKMLEKFLAKRFNETPRVPSNPETLEK